MIKTRKINRSTEAKNLIREEKKISGLSSIMHKIHAFFIENNEKKRVEKKLEEKINEYIGRLDMLYKRTRNPLVRKSIRSAISQMKSFYAVGMLEIEEVYGSNMPLEDKLYFFRDIEMSTVESMKLIRDGLKKQIKQIKGS